MAERDSMTLELDGREVKFSNPDKPFFPEAGITGDPSAGLHERAGPLDALLDLAARDEAERLGDAPRPPHFRNQKGKAKRVQPSLARKE